MPSCQQYVLCLGLGPIWLANAVGMVLQVHYKGLRILLAWRDAQGGCSPPSYPNLIVPLSHDSIMPNSTIY